MHHRDALLASTLIVAETSAALARIQRRFSEVEAGGGGNMVASKRLQAMRERMLAMQKGVLRQLHAAERDLEFLATPPLFVPSVPLEQPTPRRYANARAALQMLQSLQEHNS